MNNETYEFKATTKRNILIVLGVGVVLTILGILFSNTGGHGAEHAEAGEAVAHHGPTLFTRIMANLWLDNIYFIGIAIIGVFFVAVQYAAQAGWFTTLLRIPMSFGYYLPIGGLLMLVFYFMGGHDLFHWTHKELYDPSSPQYDAIIAGKSWFLSPGMFIGATVVFVGVWVFLFMKIRSNSLKEDGDANVAWYKKNFTLSATFLVIFAVSSSIGAWYWLMSIDTHWFSTMFGWYVFASWFVAGLAFITFISIKLKEAGYLENVNSNHLHDLGKFMFGFSIFWTYIWFSQFFLIWYSNIPEEVVYFQFRFENYKVVFFANLLINFLFPFLALMTRDAKRQTIFLKVVCVALLLGHWLDFYMMVMPGTMKNAGSIGLIEGGVFMIFLAAFNFIMNWALSKAPLQAKNHPMMEESVHHHI